MKKRSSYIAAAVLFTHLAAFSSAQTPTVVALLPSTEIPEGVAVDAAGNAYLSLATRIARISPAGAVSTFATLPAGATGRPLGMKFDAAGNLYAAGAASGIVWRITPAGQISAFATLTGSNTLNDLAIDAAGNLYVTDSGANEVYRVTPAGAFQKWSTDSLLKPRAAPTLFPNAALGANGIEVTPQGDVLVAITQPGRIVRIRVNPDGTAGAHSVVIENELLASVDGIALDTNGDIYAGLNIQNRIAVIKPDGRISTIAAGGPLVTTTTIAFGRGGSERSLFVCNNGHFFPGADATKTGLVRIDIGALADPATPPSDNFAARGRVGPGADALVAGFSVSGPRSKTMLIRGVGAALAGLGVTGNLADPRLELYRGQTVIDSNDNWAGTVSPENSYARRRPGAIPA
ncbi:MAG: SMP-30/gluconolactonase/LRE family protein [Opitutaceae bacterium]|nr:SMP-30/gluconolactonase/LRE family protein [Opitutaceae bacterium]